MGYEGYGRLRTSRCHVTARYDVTVTVHLIGPSAALAPVPHDAILGLEHIDKIIDMDQQA